MSKSAVVRGASEAAVADSLVEAELKTPTRFAVMVDYTEPIFHRVTAGEFGCANPNITAENFPVAGTGIVKTEVVLVPFDRSITSNAEIKKMERLGLEHCKIEHLLALGAKYPHLQREFSIICFGSSWVDFNGERRVPSLFYWRRRRRLGLNWLSCKGGDGFRLAAVHKS